jgi:membrane fusion protein, multidrug efflux system
MLSFALMALAATARAHDEAPQPSVLVQTAAVQKGALEETITAYGLIQAAPGTVLDLSLPYSGQVLQLRVSIGQKVRKGDPLFEYGTDPGVSLAYRKAVSALNLAKQEKAHVASLAAQKLATQSQLDQAETAVRDAEGEVAEQQRLGGDEPSRTVDAPFAGVVASVAVSNGDHIQANAAILQLSQAGGLEGIVGVEPENASRVAPEMPVRVSAPSHPGRPVAAKVRTVGGQLDPKTQLIDVVIALPTDGGMAALPGEHVYAEIPVAELKGWIVPRAAVLTDRNGPYLFQVADGKADRVNVAIIGESGDRLAVDGPLDPGRKLVTSGNYELSNGMLIREAASAGPGQASLSAL